jgi:hypothetical protein
LERIDDESVDRRYVDFGALAARLEECIGELAELPAQHEERAAAPADQ